MTAGTHDPAVTPEGLAWKGAKTMAMDIQEDQKVVVYRGGELEYEGLWADRPEEYDGDFYLLADVEQPDIIVVC